MPVCAPPIQNFGAPNGLFCVGNWQCYPDCNDWYWMGQRRTVSGGWVGNPFSGYTLVPKPTAPCGFPGGGQSAPPPPPQTPPAPPPPAAGQPVETTQPKPPHDTAPPSEHEQCGSGASMAPTLEMERDFGFNSDEQAGWPGVGKFVGVNKYASLQTVQGETIQKQTRPTVSVPAYIEKDADGNIRVLHPATGPGEIWLAPPEIEDYHLAGEHASHTGKLAGVALPKAISRVGLNIASFKRANSSNGDDVDGYLGLGLYHPTGAYVADGWLAKLTGSIGARHLEFLSTDEDGALDSDLLKEVRVNGSAVVTEASIPSPGTVVTAASVFSAANRVLVADGNDRSADDSDFTMSQDGTNVMSVGSGSAISFSANNLSTTGTLASAAHTNSTADGTMARALENDTTHGERTWHDEVSTTDATVTTVLEFALPTDAVCGVKIVLVGTEAATDYDSHRVYTVTYRENTGLTLVDSQADYTYNPGPVPAATIDVNGANARVRVTGIAATTIRWHCKAVLDYRTETA